MAVGVRGRSCRPWRAVWRAVGALCLALLVQPCLAQTRASAPPAASAPVADGVELVIQGDVTRLVFDLTAPVAAQAHVLADPDRVIVDLPEVNFQIDPARGLPSAGRAATMRKPAKGAQPTAAALVGSVVSFRFGVLGAGKSRVVIDLAGPVRIQRVANDPGPEGRGARLVIELACEAASVPSTL